MKDIQPIASATGKAIGSLLDRVDTEFQSGTWRQFFSWMAANVGPDFQMIGNLTIDLLKTLPHLLEVLNPTAQAFLRLTDGAVKAADAYVQFIQAQNKKAQQPNTIRTQIMDFIHYGYRGHQAAVAAQALADEQAALNKRLADGHAATADLIHPIGTFTGGLQAAKTAANNEVAAVLNLNAALKGLSSGLLTGQQDQVAWKQAQQAATQAIKAATHSLDSNRASSLAARSAIIASTNAALTFANQETNLHHNTDAASRIIQAQIRYLQQHAGKSRVAKQEIDALRSALNKLQTVGPIHENIFMTGKGTWGIFGKNPVNSGLFNAPGRAAGWLVPGQGNSDTVPAMLTPGEAVVPKYLVPAVAPFLKSQGVPGFASGGIVPSYDGGVGRGFRSWMAHDWNASLGIISNSMASAMANAFKNAMSSMFSLGGGSGALGGSAAANRAIARRMFPWPASMWPAFNALEMSEAGYSLTATNPSSGAYGMAQFINGPGEYYQYGGNPNTAGGQLIGMFNYIRQRYGNPVNAWSFHLAHDYYDAGGWLPPGASIAVNTTGQPERVVPPGGGDRDLLVAILRELRHLNAHGPARTGAAVGGAINGATRLVGLAR